MFQKKSSRLWIITLLMGISGLGIGVFSGLGIEVFSDINPQASSTDFLDLEWEVYLNSTTSDWVYGIINDSSDNLYIIGSLNSSRQIFLAKYNKSGQQQWLKTWEGFLHQNGRDISIDSDGNIYVIGDVYGSVMSWQDLLLIKFDNEGNEIWNITWQWGETLGGDWYVEPNSVEIDSFGDIYVSGIITGLTDYKMFLTKFNSFGGEEWNWTYGHDDIQAMSYEVSIDSLGQIYLVGAVHPCGACYWEGLIVKFNNTGAQQWNQSISKLNQHLETYSLFIDTYDNIFVSGEVSAGPSDSDFILAKYNSSGIQQWNNSWGGSGSELGRGDIVVDPLENIYAVGSTKSYGSGGWDIYLVKFNELGIAQWYKTKGGPEADYGAGIVLDSQNNVYIVGSLWAGVNNYNTVLLKYAYDTVAPIIIINSPHQNEIYGTNAPTYNITIIEKNLESTWYTIDGGITNYSFSGLTGTFNQDAWDNSLEGDITITFYAQDRARNLESKTIIVNKSLPSLPAILGYNLFFLLGILSIVSIILAKKIRKS